MNNGWALITGASSGIGLELAAVFAESGFNLALTARNGPRLEELAEHLRSAHGIQTRVIPMDLSQPAACRAIFGALADTPVSVLVNNAGLGFYGDFAGTDLDLHTTVMRVNMEALVELTHLFLPPMLQRGEGRILNVASTAAFQPGPWINVYYASKAFVFSFTYALAEELADSPVTVTALCPGTTHTSFFERGGFGTVRAPFTMSPRAVAEAGYRGLMRGKRVVVPGWANKVASQFARRLPSRMTAAVVRRIHRKRP
jgi:short-subunit dehydrogenase